jgi:hypothetical protein
MELAYILIVVIYAIKRHARFINAKIGINRFLAINLATGTAIDETVFG